MNLRIAFATVLLAFAFHADADDKKDEKKPVPLEGTWVGKSADTGAETTSNFPTTWVLKDGKLTSINTLKDSKVEYTYKIDDTKNPKVLDVDNGKAVRKGIYKIEGDTLTVCHLRTNKAKADAERPEEFDAKKRDDVVVLVFERKKP